MAFLYAIDRFDGHDWVVLEDDAAHTFKVPRSWLPTAAQEGDVIRIGVENQVDTTTVLTMALDLDVKAKRAENAEQRREQLPHGPKGDVLL